MVTTMLKNMGGQKVLQQREITLLSLAFGSDTPNQGPNKKGLKMSSGFRQLTSLALLQGSIRAKVTHGKSFDFSRTSLRINCPRPLHKDSDTSTREQRDDL